ncbi:MAG: heavy-metal-binding family protein [Phycisphaerales bacterium]|nr:heavy-metal-binding family protein [Phycisphaerales bacterium]
MAVMTGLSGNEIFCLARIGYTPGELVIGNSVFSMGFLGSLAATGRNLLGGEVTQVTNIIHEGRLEAYQRMAKEAGARGGVGITGVSSELRTFHGQSEFLSIASTLHGGQGHGAVPAGEQISFSSSADGQELYCQVDAGFTPKKFVFGNVAYSVGAVGGILGTLKSLGRGEIKEYSDVFNHTRHLALQRIAEEAYQAGGSCVVGIETRTMPWAGTHEMLMLGTASTHPRVPPPRSAASVITSDLTNEEMWNLVHLGYMPLKLVLGTAVYSLGVVGGLMAAFKGLTRGEVPELTSMIYDAREHAVGLLRAEAAAIGADDVVGLKTHVHEHGGLLEFMAIGTAVKRMEGLTTLSPDLPAQAIIVDKDTWIDEPAVSINRAAAMAANKPRR